MAYLGAATFGGLAFLLGRCAGRLGRRPAVAGYGTVLLLLLLKATLNHRPDWEFALFPWPQYLFLQGWLVYPIGLLALGLAAGLLPPGRNRRAVTVLAGFVFAVSLWTERWVLQEPDTSSRVRAAADHHCPQTTSYSCGAAACVTLLSYLGIDGTEGEMMGFLRTPPHGGTSLFRIAHGLKKKLGDGFAVDVVDGATLRAGIAIVTVHRVHVVSARFDDDGVTVHDPAKAAPETMSLAAYRSRYSGFAVTVARR